LRPQQRRYHQWKAYSACLNQWQLAVPQMWWAKPPHMAVQHVITILNVQYLARKPKYAMHFLTDINTILTKANLMKPLYGKSSSSQMLNQYRASRIIDIPQRSINVLDGKNWKLLGKYSRHHLHRWNNGSHFDGGPG
jgi:hypothetical protein